MNMDRQDDMDVDMGSEDNSIQSPSNASMDDDTESETSGSLPLILDGKFYEVVGHSKTDAGKVVAIAKCQTCGDRSIRGLQNCSSNFLGHLRNVHGETAVAAYNKYKKEKSKSRKPGGNRRRKANDNPQLTQKEFENLLARYTVTSMIPFSAVENEALKEMMMRLDISERGLRLPSRRTHVKKIGELFRAHKDKLKGILATVTHVCTTADIWSGRRRSFLGVTVHWIDGDEFTRKSAALACRRFKSSHTYDRIAQLIYDIHEEFGLNGNKVVGTVTDNATNFAKAFRTFGVAENVIELENDDITTASQHTEYTPSSSSSEDEAAGRQQEEKGSSFDYVLLQLPKHIRCAAHTLNLIVTADVEKFFITVSPRHKPVMAKCNTLWKLMARPKSAEIISAILGVALKRPCETRWNSLFDALSQLANISTAKLAHLYKELKVAAANQLTADDILYINEYVECSEPLAITLDLLQGEKNVFYGLLLPTLLRLRTDLINLTSKTWKHATKLIDVYVDGLHRRFEDYFDFKKPASEWAAIAALSNPNFKHTWIKRLDSDDQNLITSIMRRAVAKELPEPEPSQQQNQPKPGFEYIKWVLGGVGEEDGDLLTREDRADQAMTNYYCDGRVEFEMLKDYPAIQKLFFKYNTCLPSSAPVERMFSYATMVNRPKANRLSDENFERRVILKANANV